MQIQDYKGKDTHRTLGLKKGKAVTKKRPLSKKRIKLLVWIGLVALVVFLNYLVFVRLGPLGKKEITAGPVVKENTGAHTFEQWFDEGHKNYQKGDLSGAENAYTQAIMQRPDEVKSHFNRAIVYITMGEYDKAIEDYTEVISMQADYPEAYHNRGWAYFHKDMLDRAIEDCNQALLLDPDMASAHLTRGMAYEAKGLLNKAKGDFQKSCELGDNNGCQAYGELLKKQ
jgi:tetratricopeptide (TPR) repeat protein